jgi:hypothetical protein
MSHATVCTSSSRLTRNMCRCSRSNMLVSTAWINRVGIVLLVLQRFGLASTAHANVSSTRDRLYVAAAIHQPVHSNRPLGYCSCSMISHDPPCAAATKVCAAQVAQKAPAAQRPHCRTALAALHNNSIIMTGGTGTSNAHNQKTAVCRHNCFSTAQVALPHFPAGTDPTGIHRLPTCGPAQPSRRLTSYC